MKPQSILNQEMAPASLQSQSSPREMGAGKGLKVQHLAWLYRRTSLKLHFKCESTVISNNPLHISDL